MNEDFVTYEQAQKLKKLGFDWECNHYYGIDYKIHEETSSYLSNYCHRNDRELTAAPTLSQAQKWLREKKSIKVYIKPLFSSNQYEYWISFQFRGCGGDEDYGVKDTWERALLAGIDQALKMIKYEEKRNKPWYNNKEK